MILSSENTAYPAYTANPARIEAANRKAIKIRQLLKKGIWAYILLLIFEGALRKWVLPGLSTPLLIIRDPIAIWMLILGYQYGYLPKNNPYIISMYVVTTLAFFSALLAGHGSIPVAIFGARIFLFHFPIIFLIGKVFTRQDVVKVGNFLVWLTIPMTFLIAWQFFSPQSAWVNRGVGGDTEGAGFSGALGFFRPPGTFSFTNGNTFFYSLAVTFILYFWLNSKDKISKFALVAATACIVAAVPFSMSRAFLFQIGVCIIFAFIAIAGRPKYVIRFAIALIACAFVVFLMSSAGFFQTATEAFTTRFTQASDSEGGLQGTLVDRFLGGMMGAIGSSPILPFFGYGLGMGTNVGAMLIAGKKTFLIAEEEWGRLIGETGILFGLTFITIRVALGFNLLKEGFKLARAGDLLPWILMSFATLPIMQGQWATPTALGFAVVGAGLTKAAMSRETNRINQPVTREQSK